MALVDVYWKTVRRKLGGAAGSSYANALGDGPTYDRRVPYLRAKSRAPRRLSPKQARQRQIITTLMRRWKNHLSDAQRADWNDLADNYKGAWYDATQTPQHLIGSSLYFDYNSRLAYWDLAINDDASLATNGYTPSTLAVAFTAADQVQVTFTPNPGAYWYLALYSSKPHYPGRQFLVEEVSTFRDQVPYGFHPQALSDLDESSPVTLTLQDPPPSGARLTFAATFMSDTGAYGDDWLTDVDTAP